MSLDRAVLSSTRRALEQRYGLALEGLSEDQIETAVSSATAAAGRDLEQGDPRLLPLVVDWLPIDESWFFRDEPLWSWLQADLGPALLARAVERGRVVRALSLGCAAGQEAFSLAILFQGLLEAAGIPGSSAAGFVEVTGIDSSPARIGSAREGVANGWSVQRCRSEWLRGRVAPAGDDPVRMRVDSSVRAMCRFEPGNVLEAAAQGSAVLGGYDLVLCRNVLIYFRADRAAQVVAALGEALDPDAVLVVSATEAHLLGGAPRLQPLGHLGAARARTAALPATGRRRGRASRRGSARTRTRPPREAASPSRPGAAAFASPAPREQPLAEEHMRRALEHVGAGRETEAMREARAALFLEPRHLFMKLLLGRELLLHDPARGRDLLRAVLEQTSLLPPESDVPLAPGLSVAQVARAARLLLEAPEGK